MGLFDKKICDICGEKIGLLGNRKLDDGNLCKDCAKKLSPWFEERRHSTVEDIKRQLESATGKSFLCISEIARCLGMGKDHTRTLLAGLDYLPSGREKRYLISDVAERIAEKRRR